MLRVYVFVLALWSGLGYAEYPKVRHSSVSFNSMSELSQAEAPRPIEPNESEQQAIAQAWLERAVKEAPQSAALSLIGALEYLKSAKRPSERRKKSQR